MIQEVKINEAQIQIILSGDIFAHEANILRQNLSDYIERGHNELSLDMAHIDFIDGTGLSALVSIHKQAIAAGGSMQIVDLKDDAKELFRLTGLDKLFRM